MKKLKQRLGTAIFLLTFATLLPSKGVTLENELQPLNLGVQIELPSKHLNEKQKVQIFTPQGYTQAASHIRYPVIYTLDGWLLSSSVSGIVSHLGNTGAMPKAIVVAIHSNREFDFGPELYAANSGWGNDKNQRLVDFSGGRADDYLKFVESELTPFIDGHFRTNDFRILIGLSPTATFALHSAWKSPELFDAHFVFAATDVLGMGYTPETTFIDKIATSLAENPKRKGYLYIASAQREADQRPQRNENITALKKALQPFSERYKIRAEHIADFGHYPVALPGLLAALDLVFPREKWDQKRLFQKLSNQPGKPLENIKAYFKALSDELGFQVYPNADLRRNALCYRVTANMLRRQKRYNESIEIYREWIKDYPQSAKAYGGLAQTLVAAGEQAQAISMAKQAIVIAEQTQPTNAAKYHQLLGQIKKE